jgi:NAD(P)H-quinone oxidoreductase subunit 2
VILLSERYHRFVGLRLSSYFGLLLLSAVGLIFLSSANDFLMIFLSIELFGVPSFILVGTLRN